MAELNPHRNLARTFAFACYVFTGLILVVGVLLTIMAAMMDMSQLELEGVTNPRMAAMIASIFLIISLMIGLLGWRAQRLFGKHKRQDKPVAQSAVSCLRLGSLGCALWAVPSTASILFTGKMLVNGEPAGWREIFIGISGFIVVISLMLAVAKFIAVNYGRLNEEERKRAFNGYQEAIRPYLPKLAEPKARTYVQEETMEVLQKLDPKLKSNLLVFLFQSGLLSGDTRLALRGADFRGVDLGSINLPRADLHGINLERAILRDAVLFKANLRNARLKNADLSRANLQEADLRQADLAGALFEETNLIEADLTGTRLTPEQRSQTGLSAPLQ